VQKTRRQILDILKRNGTATLDDLAGSIGLSPVTIRAHLSLLERDDLIVSEEVRGKVGRPHFAYSLAVGAQDYFPKADHLVANRFLDAIRRLASPEQMELLVEQVAEQWAAERQARVAGKNLEDRVAEVARIRTEEGAVAEWERHDGGYVIRQHHCPACRVAQEHPEVCRAELEYVRRLLAVPVNREVCIVGGERKCSFHVGF